MDMVVVGNRFKPQIAQNSETPRRAVRSGTPAFTGALRAVIISASYRCDIPAFYPRWFANRLDAGWCEVRNPWSGKISRVALDARSVTGFVFWTRRTAPFMAVMQRLRDRGTPFVVQFTITGYPRDLEPGVADWRRAVDDLHEIADRFGPRVPVWRYDPVIETARTPSAFHIEQVSMLSERLTGASDEVVLSFAHIYAKTRRSLDRLAPGWRDPPANEKRAVLRRLGQVASANGLRPTVCAQPGLVSPPLAPAACIDADRLADVGGLPVRVRQKGNRPGCLCAESRDVGAYDSCIQGCVYCYAVHSRATARRRMQRHDPECPVLIPQPGQQSASSPAVSSSSADTSSPTASAGGGGSLATPTIAARSNRSPRT